MHRFGCIRWGCHTLFISFLFSLSSAVFAGPTKGSEFRTYGPNPVQRPHQRSIDVKANWYDFIRFLPNRGESGVHYLTEVLKLLDPAKIKKIKGFKSAKQTRITLSSLEFRSSEVMKAVENLLEAGFHVRMVVDGGFAQTIQMPTKEEWDSWSEHQRRYFVNSFDSNEDGSVDANELRSENRFRLLSEKTWNRAKYLKHRYPKLLELIESPREVVPVRDEFNYPRLHHTKALTIQFRKGNNDWGGPVIDLKTSANFTDTCLDRRIIQHDSNMNRYVSAGKAERLPQSQGHIQFGAVFGEKHQDPEALAEITERLESWYKAYADGKAYDSVAPAAERDPTLIFKDGSSLEVFYSEGQRLDGKRNWDPIWAITETLNRKDLQLTAYFDTQFVFTHTAFAKHLRSVLSRHRPKDVFVAVDGSQAVEPWSAIPHALFAPVLRETAGVLPGKAIEDTPEIDKAVDWENNFFVYRGGTDWNSRENDKLHLKARYFEFINAEGEKVYVVMWGSANTSHNTSKLSADVSYILKTKDPRLAKIMRPFFEAIRKDPRMMPYRQAYLAKVFLSEFHPTKELQSIKFLDRFAAFLSGGKRRENFDTVLKVLKTAGASTMKGKMMLRWLEWNAKYREPLSEFGWDDFWLIHRVTDSGRAVNEEFFDDLRAKWTTNIKKKTSKVAAQKAFNAVRRGTTESVAVLTDGAKATDMELAKARLRENCESFLTLVRKGGRYKRVREPVVGKRHR